ncbi:MAG: HAMP domain-containing histidine kinase [Gemmataceae bacterium]|nr:HAMP domain-containing histidine kinase [Gemmataceae bacterium]
MARPRRLRHKLMLGLGLVVGSVGLLLAGTLYGLNAYLTTVKTTERKVYELQHLNILVALTEDHRPGPADLNDQNRELSRQVEDARLTAGVYRDELARTVAQGLDPDAGQIEGELLDQFDDALARLTAVLAAAQNRLEEGHLAALPLREHPAVKPAYDEVRRIGGELRNTVVDDIGTIIRRSNGAIRQSLWVIGVATVQLLVIVAALLLYFRDWIYAPIRELQSGVQRVHAGDFDHPIRLGSRDELEELADEFNAMTVRLSAIYRDLARQVNERSRQLVRSERMVSVGFLAAGVAHEINNPLASILFCAEALERRVRDALTHAPAADAEVLTRYMTMIQQEALRCKDITQKLLDFSRTGDRKREPTDLAALVRGVLEVARHLPNCRGKGLQFTPAGYVVAPVNAQDLKSVILNLVVNALDSMDDNGTLTITLATRGGSAELAFADTGCGMTPDVLENIFEPFFTKSRTGKGTGLGLFISHQIVDQHGGQIEAASPGPGKGSTFTVRVPLAEAPARPADAAPPADPGPDPAILAFPGKRAA